MRIRTAIYARVSLKDGRQDVENQLRLLREYAQREGLEVVKEYVDHGTGGNGYAFLKLYRRTGNTMWLERARAFAQGLTLLHGGDVLFHVLRRPAARMRDQRKLRQIKTQFREETQ